MKKFFSLFCAVMVTVLAFGQSYGILVNGHTYFAGEPAGENEGFTQYLSHVQLQAGDYCQLYDVENDAAWAVTLNPYSVEGFALNNDRYDVTVDGCYDFYIKLKYGQDELYIGNGSNCGEGQEIAGGDEWAEIKFTAATPAGAFNDSLFTVEGSEFSLKCKDTDNKQKSTANNCSFGTSEDRHDYTFRLQTSGKSSNKNNMELNIPAAGQLRIAVRTGSSSDLTRTLVLVQGNDTIYNKVVVDTDTVEGSANPKIFNFVYVNVAAGKVAVSYPVNALNFYSFAFKEGAAPIEPEDPAKFYITGDSALVVDAGMDKAKAWNPDAIKAEADTFVLNLKANQDYLLKLTLDGTWNTAKGYGDLTEQTPGLNDVSNDHNIGFKLTEAGSVQVIYIAGETPIFKLVGNFHVDTPVEPTLANGFYLIGQNGWDVAALSADLLFAANPTAENEYVLTTTLAENDHIKVVKVENDAIVAWYPDGEGNEYIVDAAHAGESKDIYFQETYKEDWAAFGGFIWTGENSATAISNTAADVQAVKVLNNGMLLIRKGDKTYTIMGQAVK